MLLPQDILLVLKFQALQGPSGSSGYPTWTFTELGDAIGISSSQAHTGMNRAIEADLIRRDGSVKAKALLETLLATKHYFPGKFGGLTRGIPTGYAAPPLSSQIPMSDEPPPVWPYAEGTVQGLSFEPLYKTAPQAAIADKVLYEYLALVDSLRSGRAREAALAREELQRRLGIDK